ncbi:hypothetical protein ACWGCW_12620 [Streptomyces sp. NPDC054933]
MRIKVDVAALRRDVDDFRLEVRGFITEQRETNAKFDGFITEQRSVNATLVDLLTNLVGRTPDTA